MVPWLHSHSGLLQKGSGNDRRESRAREQIEWTRWTIDVGCMKRVIRYHMDAMSCHCFHVELRELFDLATRCDLVQLGKHGKHLVTSILFN